MLRHSGKEVVRRDAILRRRRNSYASSGAFRPYELRGSQEIRRADEAETAYQERRPRRRYPTASRGDRLQTVWRTLDELQRAAVAEVVHSEGTYFRADRFRAKYGSDPVWESGEENRYYR